MGTFHSFAQELEKKIRRDIQQDIQQDLEPDRTSPEVHSNSTGSFGRSEKSEIPIQSELWSFLVGAVHPVRFTAAAKANIYHSQRKPMAPRPPHQLSAVQQWAIDFFAKHEAALSPRFSQKELQSAFRKLALSLHPDQGGSPVSFQNLVTARAELSPIC